jgi:dTDP-4-dehydrorhamnose 3,5-epimerase
MRVARTALPDVLVVQPGLYSDARGYFLETWNEQRYLAAGIPTDWVQDNVSFSRYGVLRGLHFQNPYGQAKLVTVLQGEILDVAVDVRCGSPTYGRWVGEVLSAENARQLYIPIGFAHGFVVRSGTALVAYKCSMTYHPESEWTLQWDDPALGVDWGISNPELSPKDRNGLGLHEIPAAACSGLLTTFP